MPGSPFIRRFAVIGVGLIGGSLARAVRAAGAAEVIVGIDTDEENLLRASELGVVDEGYTSLEAGVNGVDVVFVATPVCSIANVVASIAPHLAAHAVVTDGGSVKEEVVAACEALMPAGRHFIGGHPIAGTEQSGVTASFATLFRGKRCILTPTAATDPGALEIVTRLWEAAGSAVVTMDPVKHDHVVSAISHLPHMVAYSLVNAVGSCDRFNENLLQYSAGGFRDFTRIASSDPIMWRDIALMNRDAVLEMMDSFAEVFAGLRSMVADRDAAGLEDFFARSKKSRDGIL